MIAPIDVYCIATQKDDYLDSLAISICQNKTTKTSPAKSSQSLNSADAIDHVFEVYIF